MKIRSKLFMALGLVVIFGMAASMSLVNSLDAMPKFSKATALKKGEAVYTEYCKTCHQANGEGLHPVYPPLVKSDFLAADHKRNIQNILFGLSGEITVNGKKYNGVMPPIPAKYTDEDIAGVLTYVYHNFGNKPRVVQPEEVAAVRKEGDPNKKATSGGKKKKKKKK